ncbi:GNAT family N-acetyltransferase [Pedobacter sp. SYP-B3415]|uniref:GNAT family N-acetyltransferase n=1 Tax=Pedobacter sp. SYP-B3415 TaxID=2496641 RepID=UPI00101CDFB5|nr:GNAT family N-acetyltransferase [Pedobacter sp. SYP-B3415]
MHDIQIRKAVAGDCVRMMELVNELALYEKAPEEVTVSMEEFIDAGFGEKPVWEAFVAEEQGIVIGLAIFYTRYSTWKGRRLYLEDFLVTDASRGRGVGTLLFERVMKEAADRNYNGMTWQVLDWNEPALNFYRKYAATIESGWLNASFSEEVIKGYSRS